jgi:hypothetical protein
MTVVKPPTALPEIGSAITVFLAGSIEMGTAVNWQKQVEDALAEKDVVILNPRRDDWDPTWEQKASNPKFNEQVTWELAAQEQATVIAMYFDPNTKSPITLLELGLFGPISQEGGDDGNFVVCCPEGYWRKGNVDMVCERYGIKQVQDLNALVEAVKNQVDLCQV